MRTRTLITTLAVSALIATPAIAAAQGSGNRDSNRDGIGERLGRNDGHGGRDAAFGLSDRQADPPRAVVNAQPATHRRDPLGRFRPLVGPATCCRRDARAPSDAGNELPALLTRGKSRRASPSTSSGRAASSSK